MARTVVDLLALVAVFAGLWCYERLVLRYRRDEAAKNQPPLREVFENAEWEAVLRMRGRDIPKPDRSTQYFAVAVDREVAESGVGATAGSAANAAEE